MRLNREQVMRLRRLCELAPSVGLGEGMPSEQGIVAYLLIETNRINVVLRGYSFEGMLSGESTHASVREAEAAAELEFPARLVGWLDVPMEYASMADIVGERERQRLADGADRVLRYQRREPGRKITGWWEWVPQALISMALFLSFCFVIVDGKLLGLMMAEDEWPWWSGGFLEALFQGALVGILAAPLLWAFPRVQAMFGGAGIFGFSLVLYLMLTLEIASETRAQIAVALVSVAPFCGLAIWCCRRYLNQWME